MLDDVQEAAGRARRSSVSHSFLDRSQLELRALCAASGFDGGDIEQATGLLADMLAPWGQLPIGSAPRCASEIGDDHYPIEFSLALGAEVPEVRVLFEAQAVDSSVAGRFRAALELNRRLELRCGVDSSRLREVQALFEPRAAQASYGIWHSICLRPRRAPKFKVYLNPQARGRESAHALMCEALDRLGFGGSGRDALRLLRPGDEIKFFSLDLDASSAARVKIYKIHREATRQDIEAELGRARCYEPGVLTRFFRTVAGSEGPFCNLPLSTYLALRAGDERPSSCTVHFPTRAYADDDEVVRERVSSFLGEPARATYQRALQAFARRPLKDGIGLHAYVALGLEEKAARVTVYLAPEAYRVVPARGGERTGTRPSRRAFADAPRLRGRLDLDLATRSRAARDVGGLISKLPAAVLRPACVDDVLQMVRFCGRRGIRIAARGQGHTTFGQAQVHGGLVIDMSSLDTIHDIEPDHAVVDPGVTWRRLLAETLARGSTPPVLTGFQGLSVGGTLSAGGISGLAYDKGAQVDHVLELDVVTGDGQLVTCSEQQNRPLFDAVLAGLGRCALIVRATLRLVPACTHVRETILTYSSAAPFLRDLRELAGRRSLDSVSGTIFAGPREAVRYELNALSFFTPPAAPRVAELSRGLQPAACRTQDREYLEHYLQVDRLIESPPPAASWSGRVHPWFDVFLPDAQLDRFLHEVIRELTPEDVGPASFGALGQMHLFPLWSRHLRRPLLRVPGGELVFLFDILTSAHTSDPEPGYVERMLARNRRLYERARELGGTRYGIAAIPFSEADLRREQGASYANFSEQKRRCDPHGVIGEALDQVVAPAGRASEGESA